MVSLQLVFFGDAFCKLQLILRRCGCGVAEQMVERNAAPLFGVAGFAPKPNF